MLPRLTFDRGTLILSGLAASEAERLPGAMWDPRVASYRAPAWRYPHILYALGRRGLAFADDVFTEGEQQTVSWQAPQLRPYQYAALTAWQLGERRGIVQLPTGSGKTRLAIAAMASVGMPSLCLVPTRVLLHQWVQEIRRWYRGPVGCWGDGERRTSGVTVCTYESGIRQATRLGKLFPLVVVDEVHHFGARMKDEALEMSAAPMRLGLTATLPEDPLQLERLCELAGPVVYELSVGDLAGRYLADYDIVVMHVSLDANERRRYAEERSTFSKFYKVFRRTTPSASWTEFVQAANASAEGRRALAAWRQSRRVLAYPSGKRRLLREILARHFENRVLVFTPDNETAYAVAREHLVMPLTCDIGRKEREAVLEQFRRGQLRALVSSQVLNEGLDVPDADVAVIVGGSGGGREHVQRIGRLLRPTPGKRAVVYETVVSGTSESRAAVRRREALDGRHRHSA